MNEEQKPSADDALAKLGFVVDQVPHLASKVSKEELDAKAREIGAMMSNQMTPQKKALKIIRLLVALEEMSIKEFDECREAFSQGPPINTPEDIAAMDDLNIAVDAIRSVILLMNTTAAKAAFQHGDFEAAQDFVADIYYHMDAKGMEAEYQRLLKEYPVIYHHPKEEGVGDPLADKLDQGYNDDDDLGMLDQESWNPEEED